MQDIWDKLYEKAMKVLNPRKISDIVEVGGVASAVEAESGNIYVPICSIGIVKKKKRRNRFGYAVLRYNYLVLKSFNYLSSFSVILFRTLQSKPFSEFIG